jgi:hypothetical protein
MAVRKMFQTTKKIPTFSIPRPFRIYPNWCFWFENKPSGNPGYERGNMKTSFEQYICAYVNILLNSQHQRRLILRSGLSKNLKMSHLSCM